MQPQANPARNDNIISAVNAILHLPISEACYLVKVLDAVLVQAIGVLFGILRRLTDLLPGQPPDISGI